MKLGLKVKKIKIILFIQTSSSSSKQKKKLHLPCSADSHIEVSGFEVTHDPHGNKSRSDDLSKAIMFLTPFLIFHYVFACVIFRTQFRYCTKRDWEIGNGEWEKRN